MCKFKVQLLSVFKRETCGWEKGLRERWRQMSGREWEVKSAQSEKAQGR